MVLLLAPILLWLLIGFLARGFYRYRTLTNFIKENKGQYPTLSAEHDAATAELGRFKHEFVGLILFLCGLIGFFTILTYAAMDPDENDNISIKFIF